MSLFTVTRQLLPLFAGIALHAYSADFFFTTEERDPALDNPGGDVYGVLKSCLDEADDVPKCLSLQGQYLNSNRASINASVNAAVNQALNIEGDRIPSAAVLEKALHRLAAEQQEAGTSGGGFERHATLAYHGHYHDLEMLSLLAEEYLGGAHGNYAIENFVFQGNQRLSLRDLLTEPAQEQALLALAKQGYRPPKCVS